ncbi:MAG: hypothetical protein BAJALOKI1v1_100021 [Promethearchaeota archaeon]|nr:MAG: hypothetical protein BAJALOKI1v1_100021 [Candidatus Lokiarchaeota archaeon]
MKFSEKCVVDIIIYLIVYFYLIINYNQIFYIDITSIAIYEGGFFPRAWRN